MTTCSFRVSLLFDLSIKLLSELMILSSALMNSRFAVDFGLRERGKFWFSIFDLRRSHLWSYWVEWELVLIVRLCSITCRSIWYIICFDRSLSPERVIYDAILIMIDKLIKYVIYISTIKDLNVKRLANLLWWKFVSQHKMMQSIMLNQDSLFISHFWITLCWYLEAKWKLSTAFHLQIDDQTERQNQMLEHYLRVYFNYKMNNWSELLSMTTFAYNNNVHASIKKTSHELLKKYIASFTETSENKVLKRKTLLTTKWAEWLQSIREHLMKLWKWIAEQQAKYYNAHHKAASFQMKDKVLLRSINIHTLRSKKKIDHKQLKSFRILKKINT